MSRILVVEDSPEAQELIRRALPGFSLEMASTLAEARAALGRRLPALVLLDATLPDGDGFRFCTELRADAALDHLPIVFLTARAESADKVMAFKLGAEDYVQKPFDAAELRVRVETRLRQAAIKTPGLSVPGLSLDPVRQEVRIDGDRGTALDLTPREYRILHCLAARLDEPVGRAELIEKVWDGISVSERTVDTHVSNLRRKLGAIGDRVQSVRNIGYRLARDSELRTEEAC